MAEIEANGVRLYYEAHGQGHPLALVHGSWGDASSWIVAGLRPKERIFLKFSNHRFSRRYFLTRLRIFSKKLPLQYVLGITVLVNIQIAVSRELKNILRPGFRILLQFQRISV